MIRLIACLSLIFTGAVQAGQAGPSNVSSAHFDFIVEGDVTTTTVAAIAAHLERERPRVLADLNIASMPRVSVYLFSRKLDFERARQGAPEGLSESSGFVAFDPVMSVNVVVDEASITGDIALHQFTHLASLSISSSAHTRSRWLWESIALFEANQFVPPHTLSCISLSHIPRLRELDSRDNPMIDKLGYLLGEFIRTQHGDNAFAMLLKGVTLSELTGSSVASFEDNWHRFVANRYLRNRIPPTLTPTQIATEVAGSTFYLEDGRNLYFARDRTIHLKMGNRTQSGQWYTRGGTDVCWRMLNLPEFCVTFRMNENRYWLDTPGDCARYTLRREKGNPERY